MCCTITYVQVEPYHCQTYCSLGEIRKSKRLEYALSEADSFATLNDLERLSKCEYTENTVKVEESKSQSKQSCASSSKQKAQDGKRIVSTGSNRKRRPSNSSKTTSTQLQGTLQYTTNTTASSHASTQGPAIGLHKDLFKTLGMGFNETNHINLVANTLIQQIQAQVLAALGQNAVTTTTDTQPPRGIVHVATF